MKKFGQTTSKWGGWGTGGLVLKTHNITNKTINVTLIPLREITA